MILVIDTTSSRIKLLFGDKYIEVESAKQSIDLPKLISEILNDNKPDVVGVIVGPGSFTGIRLGIAFAKGLALGFDVPIIGINVFDLFDEKVLAIDSGRGDYFIEENGQFTIEKNLPNNARLIKDYDLCASIKIISNMMKSKPQPVIPLYIRPSYVG